MDIRETATDLIETLNATVDSLIELYGGNVVEAAIDLYGDTTTDFDEFLIEAAVSESYVDDVAQRMIDRGVNPGKVFCRNGNLENPNFLISLLINLVGKKKALEMITSQFEG